MSAGRPTTGVGNGNSHAIGLTFAQELTSGRCLAWNNKSGLKRATNRISKMQATYDHGNINNNNITADICILTASLDTIVAVPPIIIKYSSD
jgi:hypothetical protein